MDALIYLHNTKHMLHRDICPENIFFCRDGMFAEKYTVLLAPDFTLSYNVLRAGYSPPEQNMKGDQHPCIDVYSLGATAYYLLMGKAPPERSRAPSFPR